ncbi:MAG: hypothetical protein HKP61_15945 [Dactylosporangium sp.]|nr:hypothetical protein [Dactylosporangium sp.]NNJ62398.1 hypothetical protein [Dactylosporangium sp.]
MTGLWVVADLLGEPRDLETVTVVLAVDLPVETVAWWTEPPGAGHWANATRMATTPVLTWWRSAHVPVWNHRIERPALVWDTVDGIREQTLAALRAGRGADVRTAAPTAEALRERLRDELAVSRHALRSCTEARAAPVEAGQARSGRRRALARQRRLPGRAGRRPPGVTTWVLTGRHVGLWRW